MAFMNRFPALRKAFTSMQATFDDVAELTDDDLAFITRVRGAPPRIWTRLQRNGRWLIISYLTQPMPTMKTPPKPPSPI